MLRWELILVHVPMRDLARFSILALRLALNAAAVAIRRVENGGSLEHAMPYK